VSTITFLANARYQLGQREEGIRLFTDTMNAIRALDPPETNGLLAWVGGWYAGMLIEEGRTGEALVYAKEALASARRINPNSLNAMVRMAGLASSLEADGQLKESERIWRETLELCLQNPTFGPSHEQTLNKQFGLGRVLVRQRRTDEALSGLSPMIATYHRHHGSNYHIALRAEAWLALALDQKGDTAAVARLYTDMYPRLMKTIHNKDARYSFEEMANFFVREHNYAQAKLAYDALRQIYETVSSKKGAELEWFVKATAATKGWSAAADMCRKNFDIFPDSLWIWLNKAWIYRYAGDEESYQRVVRKVLAVSPSIVTTNDQHCPIETAALGSFPFSAEHIGQLDAMMNALEVALPGRSTNQQEWGCRAIAHLQLRLGRLEQCLAALEKLAKQQISPASYDLFIKAICLHRLGRTDEARTAFEKAEAGMDSRLLSESFGEIEGFLPAWQIYQQVLMHREAKALLGLN
jgi:tetratricopeptide (TPR) repeat protein